VVGPAVNTEHDPAVIADADLLDTLPCRGVSLPPGLPMLLDAWRQNVLSGPDRMLIDVDTALAMVTVQPWWQRWLESTRDRLSWQRS
jgi:hypothetical protein